MFHYVWPLHHQNCPKLVCYAHHIIIVKCCFSGHTIKQRSSERSAAVQASKILCTAFRMIWRKCDLAPSTASALRQFMLRQVMLLHHHGMTKWTVLPTKYVQHWQKNSVLKLTRGQRWTGHRRQNVKGKVYAQIWLVAVLLLLIIRKNGSPQCFKNLHHLPFKYGGMWWRSGWGTALQTRRSRDRFPMVSLEFFIDIILLAALWPWG
jgi:hypothetical protein